MNLLYPKFILGLDLGQSRDHTALTAVDLVYTDHGIDPVSMERKRWPKLRLLFAARLPLGTDYVLVPSHVKRLIAEIQRRQPFGCDSKVDLDLYIDAAGPGRPIVDLLRAQRMPAHLRSVHLTGGHQAVVHPDGMLTIPRRELVANLRMVCEAANLRVHPGLREWPSLREELLNISLTGGQSTHDDLAIALALAVWPATREFPKLLETNPY